MTPRDPWAHYLDNRC